jgi:hypothetical protein
MRRGWWGALALAATLGACGGRSGLDLPEVVDAEVGDAAPPVTDAAPEAAIPEASVDAGSDTATGVPDASDASTDAPALDAGPDSSRLDATDDVVVDAPVEAPAPDASDACGVTCMPLSAVPPRPLAPLSTSTVTSSRPTFRWQLAPGTDGARITLGRRRDGLDNLWTDDVTGTSLTSPTTLAPGVYYWTLNPLVGGRYVDGQGPTWELYVGHGSASVDTSWGSVPDVNGDGYADVLVSQLSKNGPGVIDTWLGSAKGPLVSIALGAPPSAANPKDFGAFIASAGDVDGDGFPELLESDQLSALMYRGSASGLSPVPVTIPMPAHVNPGYGAFGAGDVNGDGYADVAVVFQQTVWPEATGVLLYYGGAGGLASSPLGLGDSTWFGTTLAALDVNGDGYGDLAVSTGYVVDVFPGGPGGLSTTPWLLFTGDGTQESVASAGDVNGDGLGDLLVGDDSPGYYGLKAFLVLGTPSGPSSTHLVVPGSYGTEMGVSLDGDTFGVGDVNGDGFGDLFVGYAVAGTFENAILYGDPAASFAGAPDLTLGPPSSADPLVSGAAGDVDGDGIDDLLLGDPDAAVTLFAPGRSGMLFVTQKLSGGDSVL